MLHPGYKCFLKVLFHVVNVEGSVIVLCATSINLNLMQIHNELDTKIPDCARLYYSSADKPRANKEKKKKVYYAVICDKNFQDTNLWAHMPTRKHKWTVTYSKKTNPGFLSGIKKMTRTVNINVSKDLDTQTQSIG